MAPDIVFLTFDLLHHFTDQLPDILRGVAFVIAAWRR
jgi:hypothetical protein